MIRFHLVQPSLQLSGIYLGVSALPSTFLSTESLASESATRGNDALNSSELADDIPGVELDSEERRFHLSDENSRWVWVLRELDGVRLERGVDAVETRNKTEGKPHKDFSAIPSLVRGQDLESSKRKMDSQIRDGHPELGELPTPSSLLSFDPSSPPHPDLPLLRIHKEPLLLISLLPISQALGGGSFVP